MAARLKKPDALKAFLRSAASIFDIMPRVSRTDIGRETEKYLGYNPLELSAEDAMRRDWERVGAGLGEAMGLKRDKTGRWARIGTRVPKL